MKRRTVVTALGLGGLVGLYGTETATDTPRPYYFEKRPIDGHNEELTLESSEQTVRYGEEITFEVTHTGDSEFVSLGCNVNWALQRSDGGEWTHVAWTGERFHQLCATGLGPGDTVREELTMSERALDRVADLAASLDPGTYRFVLFVPSPPAWTTFELE